MIAEDVERGSRERACRNVEHAGEQLARDLVHVGDHEQQTLRSGERGGQSAGCERTVDGTRRAALGLHLGDAERLPEHIELTFGRPLVGCLRHGRGRRDGIDGRDFGESVRYVRSGGIPVDSHFFHLKSSVG